MANSPFIAPGGQMKESDGARQHNVETVRGLTLMTDGLATGKGQASTVLTKGRQILITQIPEKRVPVDAALRKPGADQLCRCQLRSNVAQSECFTGSNDSLL